jgi:hypothetical protein
MVKGGELGLAEALCDGEDGAVNEADFEVGVGPHQLGDAFIVARGQVLNVQLPGLDRVEQLREGVRSEFAAEQVVKLDQDRGRDDSTFGFGWSRGAQRSWSASSETIAATSGPVSKISGMAAARTRRDWRAR